MCLTVFANTPEQTVGLVGVATLVGAAVQWLFAQWRESRKEQRAESASQQGAVVKHLEDLVRRMEVAHAESRQEVDDLREQLQAEIMRGAANTARIVYLETVLEAHDIKVKPWPDHGSKTHAALPPDPGDKP